MKFKNYPREYERVFTGNELIRKKCKIEDVSTFNNIPSDVTKYTNLFRDTIDELQKVSYDKLVKIVWLIRRFCYKGVRRSKMRQNGFHMDSAFALYMRHFVGHDNKMIFWNSSMSRIATYFDDFYPDFETNNPFEGEYKYPYKYMNLECLALVFKMTERLDLLDYGETMKMGYMEFMDYILNYLSCYNEEHGRKYIYVFSRTHVSSVIIDKNYEKNS